MKLNHKTVTIVANLGVGDRCPVSILDKYISKLPVGALDKAFYCKPLSNVPKDEGEPWFTSVPIGKNLLSKMVAEMCSEAGIMGRKTNQSSCFGSNNTFQCRSSGTHNSAKDWS